MAIGTLMKKHVTFGECIIPEHHISMRKYSGYKHNNSWGKTSFCGGEYDVGHQGQSIKTKGTSRTKMNIIKANKYKCMKKHHEDFKEVNWTILKLIIVFIPYNHSFLCILVIILKF